jgi:hypothetical protein
MLMRLYQLLNRLDKIKYFKLSKLKIFLNQKYEFKNREQLILK